MILGIPKEIYQSETRIAAIPATVKQFVSVGFKVIIESNAGIDSQILDSGPQIQQEILSTLDE